MINQKEGIEKKTRDKKGLRGQMRVKIAQECMLSQCFTKTDDIIELMIL